MPRKKGVPNKDSLRLMRILEAGGFHVAQELIELFNSQKEVLGALLCKIKANIIKKSPLTKGMLDNEVDIYLQLSKDQTGTLIRMLAHLYPKLKAVEHGTGTGDKIVFNFSGLPEVVDTKPGSKTEEATIH